MTKVVEWEINDLSALPQVAKELLDVALQKKIFLFYAAMGAGKTTLIKELCKQKGSPDHFSSPTYSIINEYTSPAGKIYHMDLYRLKDREELLDLGIENYLDSGAYCFIEWPEMTEELVAGNYVKIEINAKENIRYLRATLN